MAGMIEKNARLEFTLKQAGDEISDGKYDWISIPCRGLLLDMQEKQKTELIFMVWLSFFRDIVLTMPFFNATLIVWWVPQHKFFKQKEVQKNEKDPVNACYGICSRIQSCS